MREVKHRKGTRRQRELQIKMRMALLAAVACVFGVFLFSKVESNKKIEEVSIVEEGLSDVLQEENLEKETVLVSPTPTPEPVYIIETKTKVDDQFIDLQKTIENITNQTDGIWSVYVKDLGTNHILCMNSQKMYAASLIKLFVMESFLRQFNSFEEIQEAEEQEHQETENLVTDTLKIMIEQSDNEAYNELIRQQSEDASFLAGCLKVNSYVRKNGYMNTGIYHTLSPSDTEYMSISDIKNHTTVEDCALFLEDVYRKTNISEEASEQMMIYLLNQETRYKIPAGIPEGVLVANKTGETEETEHDVAIVFGTDTDYILCVMSSEISDTDEAVETINQISSAVYYDLNKTAPEVTKVPKWKKYGGEIEEIKLPEGW